MRLITQFFEIKWKISSVEVGKKAKAKRFFCEPMSFTWVAFKHTFSSTHFYKDFAWGSSGGGSGEASGERRKVKPFAIFFTRNVGAIKRGDVFTEHLILGFSLVLVSFFSDELYVRRFLNSFIYIAKRDVNHYATCNSTANLIFCHIFFLLLPLESTREWWKIHS